MNLVASVKRAPKWTLLTAGGVAVGILGIKAYKGRATDSEGDTGDATEVGTPTAVGVGSPTPVITPPVIIGGDSGDNGAFADVFTGLFGTFGQSLDNLVNNIGGLAAGDQALAGQAIGANTDIATAAIANAGSPPAPAVQNPTPIIVNIPTAGPVAGQTPPKGVPRCPTQFPKGTAPDCYRCERNTGADKKKYPWVHIHQNGRHVAVTQC